MYGCELCGYTTKNRAWFEKHQETDLCRRKSEREKTLEEEVRILKQQVKAMYEWFINDRVKTKEEIEREQKQEEEEVKMKIKARLTKFKIEFDKYETIEGLRYLNRQLSERIRKDKESTE